MLPPLVAIVLAILFRRAVLPLAFGVLIGALLLAHSDAANFAYRDLIPFLTEPTPEERAELLVRTSWWHAPVVFLKSVIQSICSKSHLQVFAFTVLLGAMVGVLERCGGMLALIGHLTRRVRSRCAAQTMIATSGLVIFFDDYANTLLVGGTMRSTADKFNISREKLAYLVDSTAGPVAGLALISTWAAVEISYMADGLKAAGIEDSSAAFLMFVQSIPYRFYPWLALALVFCVAITGRDFGAMKEAEEVAQGQEHVHKLDHPSEQSRWLWLAAVLPITCCVGAVFAVIAVTGYQAVESTSFHSTLQFFGEVLGNGDSYIALVIGGTVGLLVAALSHLAWGQTNLGEILRGAFDGASQMLPAIVILWFAWALSAMTESDALNTGGYLASVLSDRMNPQYLPTVVFILSGAMAFSTGTSWGTMGVMTPLSISLALQLDAAGGPSGAIALATCGSVLAGAIFGDHCSPISDTTVLSSRASGCDHVAHVRTQMPYAVLVAFICIVVGTLPAAFGVSPWISLGVGVVVIVLLIRSLGSAPEAAA
ncbi:MAG: Na+/H+ antiporter NhaC family protein [Rubripirellula sp.]